MSDGLTVPFALAAGLSGAVNSSCVVLVAGVAEMAAGSRVVGEKGVEQGRRAGPERSDAVALPNTLIGNPTIAFLASDKLIGNLLCGFSAGRVPDAL